MRKSQTSLPLAFLLAMAAEASPAALADADVTATTFQPGDLRKLLDPVRDVNLFDDKFAKSGDRRLPGDKVAQYFPNFPNFFNCFNGMWRNC
jgi:hypothetical protein